MTKKEYWQKRNKKEDIKQHNALTKEKRLEEKQKQHNAITKHVFKGKQETSNYKELQIMNNNIWKTQKHIIDKRFNLATLDIKKESDVEKLLSKFQSLVLMIERFNNSKNKEVWEKVALTHDEFEVLAIWEDYNNIVKNDNISTYNKWQAKEVYVAKMIKLCEKLSKKYNIE